MTGVSYNFAITKLSAVCSRQNYKAITSVSAAFSNAFNMWLYFWCECVNHAIFVTNVYNIFEVGPIAL